jgi:hypothetical protein
VTADRYSPEYLAAKADYGLKLRDYYDLRAKVSSLKAEGKEPLSPEVLAAQAERSSAQAVLLRALNVLALAASGMTEAEARTWADKVRAGRTGHPLANQLASLKAQVEAL